MGNRVHHEIYLHITWHVKHSLPSITAHIEPTLHQILRSRCERVKGVEFHTVGGTDTHVHVVIDIAPHVSMCDFISKLKGGSSHDMNAITGDKTIEWQPGYGIVSFSKGDLPWVIKYVQNQKAHHGKGTISPKLEATGDEE